MADHPRVAINHTFATNESSPVADVQGARFLVCPVLHLIALAWNAGTITVELNQDTNQADPNYLPLFYSEPPITKCQFDATAQGPGVYPLPELFGSFVRLTSAGMTGTVIARLLV